MLAMMLFREGFEEKAFLCLEEGRNESFVPDRRLFQYVIHHHCSNGAYVIQKPSILFAKRLLGRRFGGIERNSDVPKRGEK